jgi:hypothetical protein
MNSLTTNDSARQAASWSGRLGRLAAELPANRPPVASPPLSDGAVPSRLSAILNHIRQRRQRQEHAADKLRAQEFVMGP